MTKHTEGPWEVYVTNAEFNQCFVHEQNNVDNIIARVDDQSNALANAKLISTAPAMLDYLRKREWISQYSHTSPVGVRRYSMSCSHCRYLKKEKKHRKSCPYHPSNEIGKLLKENYNEW